MKAAIFLVATALLIGGAITSAQGDQHARHRQASPAAGLRFSSTDDGNGRLEVTASSTRFTARDRTEAELLLQTTRPARSHGADWFVLVHTPGEQEGVATGP